MGIFSSIAGEAKRNFIARSDEAREEIIYRYPEKNVRMLTQLTCQPDEMAVFVKEGKVAGKLGPGGTFSLDSKNIPFLSTLLEKVTGGDLFVTELYFVSMREIPSVKFGGPLGSVTDVETGYMCDAMVYGDFSVKVTDPEKLIFGLVGSGKQLQTNNAFLDWFKNILMKHMSDAFGELGDKGGWPLTKMISPSFKLELADAVIGQIKPEIDKHGMEVVQFGNFVLSISDEDKQKLNEQNAYFKRQQREMQQASNPAYMVMRQGDMMKGAGEGMSKGGDGGGAALGGLGMGMGFGMANMFAQNQMSMNPGMQNPQMQGQPVPAGPQMIQCPSCGGQTPAGKFCSACGKPLAPPAAKCECGTELPPNAKFCLNCGKPAAAPGPKKCECGTELAPGAKFCPNCGKAAE